MGFFLPILFLLGAVFGSFLSVVIFRLPNEESIVWGRSQCPYCHHKLGVLELVPILSFLSLHGHCKKCRHTIPLTYPMLELVTGFLFILAFYLVQSVYSISLIIFTFSLIYYCTLFTILVALFFIDLFDQLLLDVLVLPVFIVTIVYQIFLAWYFLYRLQQPIPLPGFAFLPWPHWHLASFPIFLHSVMPILFGYGFGICAALFFLLLLVVTRGKGMGGGDVKFAVVIGAVTGWPNAIIALFAAFLIGAVVSIGLLVTRKKKIDSAIPFGPFLIIGIFIGILFGRQLVDFLLPGALL